MGAGCRSFDFTSATSGATHAVPLAALDADSPKTCDPDCGDHTVFRARRIARETAVVNGF
jgi:hypothetical protein